MAYSLAPIVNSTVANDHTEGSDWMVIFGDDALLGAKMGVPPKKN